MDCDIKRNKKDCTCSYPGCPRMGKCCECVTYHRRSGELPGCFFNAEYERTYDRSIGNFIRMHRG